MLNLTGMLFATVAPLNAKKAGGGQAAVKKARDDIRNKSRGRYRLVMEGRELTTGEIAAKRGITHMGCLNSLYQMEAEGLIERVGLQKKEGPGKATIIWRWKK